MEPPANVLPQSALRVVGHYGEAYRHTALCFSGSILIRTVHGIEGGVVGTRRPTGRASLQRQNQYRVHRDLVARCRASFGLHTANYLDAAFAGVPGSQCLASRINVSGGACFF